MAVAPLDFLRHPADPPTRPDAARGLFLSRQGTWFHDGQRVDHARLSDLLHRSITRGVAGELVVSTGLDAVPFVAEDAPVLVRALVVSPHAVDLVLSNGGHETLGAVYIDATGRLRAAVLHQRFWALFSRSATQRLHELLDENGDLHTSSYTGPVRSIADCDWSTPPDPGVLMAEV